MIWRDDDILWQDYGLDLLLEVDDLLRASGRLHTLAVIADTLTPEIAAVIRERRMSAQLHCWHHDDLSVDARAIAQLPDAIAKIEDLVGVRPTTLYPPWNRTSPLLEHAAAALGLTVSAKKISLETYIKRRGQETWETINFHYWHEPDRQALRDALAFVPQRAA